MKKYGFRSNLAKIVLTTVASILAVTMLSGCAIGPLKLDFLDSIFKKSNVNYTYILDSALVAAEFQEEDNGIFTAEISGSSTLFVNCEAGKIIYDFANKTASTEVSETQVKRLYSLTSGEFEFDSDASALAEEFINHISDMCTGTPKSILTNLDEDEENELIITAVGFARTDNFSIEDSFSEIVSVYGFTCLFVDIKDGVARFQANHIPYDNFDATSASTENGFLYLLNDKQDQVPSSIIVNSSKNDGLDTAVSNYFALLEKCGRNDIRIKQVNVNEDDTYEVIFCYEFGSQYRVEIFAFIESTFAKILNYNTARDHYGLFLLENEDVAKFFIYNQNVTSEYTLEYNFTTYSLGSDYLLSNANSASISVDTRESVSTETNDFFESVTNYLSSASVCYDPYKLTGYNLLFGNYNSGAGYDQPDYVTISNCSTNKNGYVLVDDGDTWLNLREGPSKKYDRVLMDPNDKKSYVKQSLFSPVTIIQPFNTGDEDNPIWVEIEINYMDRILVGYSSQKYIVIPGIRHLSVGDTFQIEAQTNSDNLYWATTDSDIASVDSETGMLYANSTGLVLVSVTTEDGNFDSCLLMID